MELLLATDLDNTLVGDDQGTVLLNQWVIARRDRLLLVYATGRSYPSAKQLQAERNLLEPDFWITSVGTEIRVQDRLDAKWMMVQSEGWNRDAIAEHVQNFPLLIPQPATEQNPWKLSYWLDQTAPTTAILDFQRWLANQGWAAQIIFSHGVDVDILPVQSNKGNALQHVCQQLPHLPATIVACGDSGNDIGLFQAANLKIIVGNAQLELLDWFMQQHDDCCYCAAQPCAWGILEGLQHFRLLST